MKTQDPTKIHLDHDPLQKRLRGTAVHGCTPFDVPYISKVTEKLWQGGCEFGLILPEEVKHVVSLYPWERYQIDHDVHSELYFKMYDSLDQSTSQLDEVARYVIARTRTGVTLVHCQAGLNRSSLVVARALMLDGPMSAEEAIKKIRESRSPACLCNPAFERYLKSL